MPSAMNFPGAKRPGISFLADPDVKPVSDRCIEMLGDVRRWCLGHTNHRRAEYPILDRVSGLQNLHDGPRFLTGILDLEHRLMEVIIKFLAHRIDLANAIFLERAQQLPLGHLDADDQVTNRVVDTYQIIRAGIQGPAKIVGGG